MKNLPELLAAGAISETQLVLLVTSEWAAVEAYFQSQPSSGKKQKNSLEIQLQHFPHFCPCFRRKRIPAEIGCCSHIFKQYWCVMLERSMMLMICNQVAVCKKPQNQNYLVIKGQAYVPPGQISISPILTTVCKNFDS